MSKKSARIIITVFLLFLVVGFAVFYFMTKKEGEVRNGSPEETGVLIFPDTTRVAPREREGREGERSAEEQREVGLLRFPALRQLTSAPVSGITAMEKGGRVFARYVERGTGHIFEIGVEEEVARRLSNKTIPRIAEALFNADGEEILLRYLREGENVMETFAATLKEGTAAGTGGELEGTFRERNMREVVLSPKRDRIFYLLENGTQSLAFTATFDGSRKTRVFSSPLKEVRAQWPQEDTVALTTAPAAGTPGHVFLVTLSNGVFNLTVRGIPGLTTLVSPTLSEALVSSGARGGLTLSVRDLKRGRGTETPFVTLPEKCVWSRKSPRVVFCAVPEEIPPADYPDHWYQGVVSFSDAFWKLRTDTVAAEIMHNSAATDSGLDATSLTLDPTERYLFFINKKDLTPWGLRIAE